MYENFSPETVFSDLWKLQVSSNREFVKPFFTRQIPVKSGVKIYNRNLEFKRRLQVSEKTENRGSGEDEQEIERGDNKTVLTDLEQCKRTSEKPREAPSLNSRIYAKGKRRTFSRKAFKE